MKLNFLFSKSKRQRPQQFTIFLAQCLGHVRSESHLCGADELRTSIYVASVAKQFDRDIERKWLSRKKATKTIIVQLQFLRLATEVVSEILLIFTLELFE